MPITRAELWKMVADEKVTKVDLAHAIEHIFELLSEDQAKKREQTRYRVRRYRERKRLRVTPSNALRNVTPLFPEQNQQSGNALQSVTTNAYTSSLSLTDKEEKKVRMDRRHRMPADFQPTKEDLDFALEKGVRNPGEVWKHFCDHHRAKGTVMVDWRLAWRTWVRNDAKFNQRPSNGQQKGNGNGYSTSEFAKAWEITSRQQLRDREEMEREARGEIDPKE